MAESKTTKNSGKKAIPMEFIKDPKKRYVTFSKRKQGLFNKTSMLCSLFSPTTMASIFVFSPKGNLFCFAHPDPDTVINRYLYSDHHRDHDHHDHGFWWDRVDVDDLSLDQLEQFRVSLQDVRDRALLALNIRDYDGFNLMDNQPISVDDYDISGVDFVGFNDFDKISGDDNDFWENSDFWNLENMEL